MTQQNVRENIEAAIDLFFRKNNCGYSVYEMNVCLDQIRAYFLEWVKEAGYKSQEDCETCFGKFVRIEEQTIQKIYDAFGGEAMKDREGEIAKVIWQGVCDSEGEFQRGYADVMTKEILAFFPEWAKEAGYVKLVDILTDIREEWAYESALGHPVMALRLEKWVEICREAGVDKDWWELKQDGGK